LAATKQRNNRRKKLNAVLMDSSYPNRPKMARNEELEPSFRFARERLRPVRNFLTGKSGIVRFFIWA
jgi:hypothetical protein